MKRFVIKTGITVALGLGLTLALLWLLSGSITVPADPPLQVAGNVVALGPGGDNNSIPDAVDAASRNRINQALGSLPLRFIPNTRQTDPAVRFTVKGAGHTIFFTEREVVLSAVHEGKDEPVHSTVRLQFLGADPHPAIEGLSPMHGMVSFFLGNDPAKWQANVSTYGAVAYRDLYPGTDLIYRGTKGHLKSEFLLAPGADPAAIQMIYSGVEAVRLREDGALVLQTPLGELIETAPLIYQEVNGSREVIAGGYVFFDPDGRSDQAFQLGTRDLELETLVVGFHVGDYDPTYPLVIDPMLVYSSYLGGSGEDYGLGMAVDAAGNVYVTGYTYSSDFPTNTNTIQAGFGGGTSDAFVTQIISASGAYTYGYSTYLGGDGDDWGYDIALDTVGDVYVTGNTYSTDFPTHNAIQTVPGGDTDGFVTQIISASGVYTLAYSSYLGGSGQDWGYSIAVDSVGNVYVAGQTSASNFPTTTNAIQPAFGGGYDGFVTHIISASGSYTYALSTYLGGDSSDYSKDVAVDGVGNVYVTGGTGSSNFPTTTDAIQVAYGGGNLDAFVTHIISASGTYTYGYSTYLGGGGYDYGWGVAVPAGSVDNVHVTGYTDSSDFPTRDAIQAHQGGKDVFVTQIISAGGVYTYSYSTYLGGSGEDWGPAIAVDQVGNIYVTGRTKSSDFPIRVAVQATHANTDTYDAFVTQIISASGAYTYGYSTYLGGDGDDWGYAIAVDGAGNAYVTGQTQASDFPTTTNAMQSGYGGGWRDAFVAKIRPPYRVYLPVVMRQYP